MVVLSKHDIWSDTPGFLDFYCSHSRYISSLFVCFLCRFIYYSDIKWYRSCAKMIIHMRLRSSKYKFLVLYTAQFVPNHVIHISCYLELYNAFQVTGNSKALRKLNTLISRPDQLSLSPKVMGLFMRLLNSKSVTYNHQLLLLEISISSCLLSLLKISVEITIWTTN